MKSVVDKKVIYQILDKQFDILNEITNSLNNVCLDISVLIGQIRRDEEISLPNRNKGINK
jgi:hypothetical protein